MQHVLHYYWGCAPLLNQIFLDWQQCSVPREQQQTRVRIEMVAGQLRTRDRKWFSGSSKLEDKVMAPGTDHCHVSSFNTHSVAHWHQGKDVGWKTHFSSVSGDFLLFENFKREFKVSVDLKFANSLTDWKQLFMNKIKPFVSLCNTLYGIRFFINKIVSK